MQATINRQTKLFEYICEMKFLTNMKHFAVTLLSAAALPLCIPIEIASNAQGSEEAITIASMTIPFAYDESGEGVYNDVLNQLVKGYEGPFKVTFLPAARLDRAMKMQQTDCIYISADTDMERGENNEGYAKYRFIGPINTISIVVYTRADDPDISETEQLDNMVVASDVNLVRFINALGIQEDHKLQSQIQMIKMLAAGRADALIGYDFDLDFLTKKLNLQDQLKKASIRLDEVDDGISCLRNEKTERFFTHVTKRLKILQDNGWLDEAFKDYR